MQALAARNLIVSTATPGDRRGVTLSLTREGTRFHARVLAFATDRNAALVSCLDKHEQRALDAILNKISTFIEIENAALSRGNARDAESAARKATTMRKTA